MSFEAPHNEWSELQAARRSEEELRRIMTEGAGRVSTGELSQVRRDAMRAMVRGLPDPHAVARHLETADPEAAETLRAAFQSFGPPYGGSWRVADNAHARVLRSMGLVGWIGTERNDGCCVGGFGNTVRKIMLGELPEQEGDE